MDDYSIWKFCKPELRSHVIEAGARLYQMASTNQLKGVEPGSHAGTLPTTYQNVKTIDWAVWELLAALIEAGYGPPPETGPSGPINY